VYEVNSTADIIRDHGDKDNVVKAPVEERPPEEGVYVFVCVCLCVCVCVCARV
jgi:hypothetical protein